MGGVVVKNMVFIHPAEKIPNGGILPGTRTTDAVQCCMGDFSSVDMSGDGEVIE